MIYTDITSTVAPPTIGMIEKKAASDVRFFVSGNSTSSGEPILDGEGGNVADANIATLQPSEVFDWGIRKLNREFIDLEQKVLARTADGEEKSRYEAMRKDRNSTIFARRALRDYAEIQRLKKLNQKLAELQQFLKPIEL